MLEEILDYIHNYFISKRYQNIQVEISSGSTELSFLQPGQYFYIKGSVFNDGVHQYPSDDLIDETFIGEIWAMSIPPHFLSLVNEISTWNEQYQNIVNSPYQSESFGGYSYTKASGSSSSGGPSVSWKDIFRNKLNRWRKIA